MAAWHVNPATGEPGRCSAVYSCPFGGTLNGHETSQTKARRLYEDFREGLASPTKSAYFYFIGDEEGEAFTQGDCGFLAQELSRELSTPVFAVGIRSAEDEPVEWVHMTAGSGDGRFMDVTGVLTEATLAENWKKFMHLEGDEALVVREVPAEQAQTLLGVNETPQFPKYSAAATAKRLVAAMRDVL